MKTRLLLLTDRAQLSKGRSLSRTIAECVDAGLEAVVVRELDLAPRDRQALMVRLAELDSLTVISSRIADPAAHGLHLAAHQERVDGLHGRSCHSADDVRRAAAEGAAWATLSPYAATASKPGHGPPLPPDAFTGDPGIPVFALGGIDPGNAHAAVEAGAHGVAVMGAVMRAAQPARVVARLLAELR
ncbi:thiamine-phosphate pyrophosphorylase [Nocardioides ginsengisegetis]|uniref:Thiamine-phosphate pyrophosphorylase n=1 Tax=Nocardioides ginsengisegetis TaxID=661491 RepID=A0A7W3IXQ7_9ACTN|nr:thiamine phosphate synthase [Nocardioides ginsengisegetis]MBA8802474.1 thiamine-phosphate pyrophosphorylase [Nocardioides ginsengisegetis]